MPSISVAIATFNESENIKKCLDAVIDHVQEIVIVDGSSQDDTVTIAKSYPKTKVVVTDNPVIFHINKQKAIDLCKSDWILQLDADEVVTPKLMSEIKKTILNTKYNGFWIKRKNYFLGRFLTKGGVYPDPTIRLYRNKKAHLPCKDVHEQAVVEGEVGWLNNDLLHFADPNFSRYLMRNNRYTSVEAKRLFDLGKNLSFFDYFIIKPTWWFLKTYFRHFGIVDGFPGFVFSFFSALRFQSIYIKYRELKNGR